MFLARLVVRMATKRATADMPVLEARMSKLRISRHTSDLEDDKCCVCRQHVSLDNADEYSVYINLDDADTQHAELFCLKCDPLQHAFYKGEALQTLGGADSERYNDARAKGLIESNAATDSPHREWTVTGCFCYAQNNAHDDSPSEGTGIFDRTEINNVLSWGIFSVPERRYTCALDLTLQLRYTELTRLWTPAAYMYGRMARRAVELLECAVKEGFLTVVTSDTDKALAVDELFKQWDDPTSRFNTACYQALTGDYTRPLVCECFAEQKLYKRTAALQSPSDL